LRSAGLCSTWLRSLVCTDGILRLTWVSGRALDLLAAGCLLRLCRGSFRQRHREEQDQAAGDLSSEPITRDSHSSLLNLRILHPARLCRILRRAVRTATLAPMQSRIEWKPAEAVHGVSIRVEDFKEAVQSRAFKDQSFSVGDCRQLDVAIALHGFFQAAQQQVESRAIHLANPGTVEHNTGTVNIHAAFQVPEKETSLFRIECFRQLLHRYSEYLKCHICTSYSEF
jgi:hypothetical protein